MDKNLVNVDNLFRQKLGGAEEKEREGAWANMRDLLDKEMPKESVAGFGWNRTMLYSGIVLLFATLGIGAWEVNSHFNIAPASLAQSKSVGGTSQTSSETQTDHASVTGKTETTAGNEAVVQTAKNTPAPQSTTNASTPVVVKSENASRAATPNQIAAEVSGSTNAKSIATNPAANQTATSVNTTSGLNLPSTARKAADKAASTGMSTTTASSSATASAQKAETRRASHRSSTQGIASNNQPKNNILAAATTMQHKIPAVGKNKDFSTEFTGTSASQSNTQPTSVRINKLVLNQRLVRDEHCGWYFTYDTVSQEMLFEQLKSINKLVDQNELSDNIQSGRVLASAGTNLPEGALKTEPTAAAPSLKANKEAAISEHKNETGAGARLINNLSAAFNDIKSTSSNVQFTKGLTGGINGTFFGPTSFYGFNFGVTGSFNFGEKFTVKTELKYYHRINSNYQLNDDYYAYEPNTGGGYRKSKIDYDFSFSTLHSLELPVSFKYNVANFSCFAGANLVYTFGINTGAAPLQDLNAPVQIVNTKSNDDQATLNYKDFGQRFGIGYLFGIAFRLDSRSEIDLRTVQTVWDNMKTDGAKTVSNTLYKSPSIQASFNYRIGGNGKKNRGN